MKVVSNSYQYSSSSQGINVKVVPSPTITGSAHPVNCSRQIPKTQTAATMRPAQKPTLQKSQILQIF